jgi:ceramide glucosyltransferase
MIQTVALGLIVLSMGLACLYAAVIILHRPKKGALSPPLPRYPRVSVLLTLRNMDDGLEENLSSVFSISYPDYSVLLAVDSLQDPCMGAVERVRARFPEVPSTVIAAGHTQTCNPKISKLAQLEKRSDAGLFWVLDSDVRVAPDTLTALVHEHIVRDAAIVFCPIRSGGARTFGSILEMSYLNFFLSGSILSAWKIFRQRVIVGKSLLIDRRAIEQFGGFSYFADVWVDNIKETSSIRTFFDRLARWALLRFHLKRPVYLLEILLNPLALVLICIPLFGRAALPLAGIVVALRIALEYLVYFAVDGDRKRFAVLCALPAAVIVKDRLMIAVYLMPFFSSSINWRGGRIRIGRDTLIPFVPESSLLDGA